MDLLVKELSSNEMRTRITAIEQIFNKIQSRSWLKEIQNDEKIKVFNEIINIIRDVNPKIVMIGLNCIEHLISFYRDEFQPFTNMSFQLLINKLGDSKLQIRTQTIEVILKLINLIGLNISFERLCPHFTNRNQKVRENILILIMKLQEIYQHELCSINNLVPSIALVLNADSQSSVRQLAINVFVSLHALYGESLIEKIGKCEIRPIQQKLLLDAIAAGKQHKQYQHNDSNTNIIEEEEEDCQIDPWSLVYDECDIMDSKVLTKKRNSSTSSSNGIRKSLASTAAVVVVSSKGTEDHSRWNSNERRSLSAGIHRPSPTMNKTTTNVTIGELISLDVISAEVDTSSKSLSGQLSNHYHNGSLSCYDPLGYMNFLIMEKPQNPINVLDDKDLTKYMNKIMLDLNKKSDWNIRLNALITLQRITLGNMIECKNSLELLRGIHDLIAIQIIDLRSIISKEACRVVAMLAYKLRNQFFPLLELWWASLIRIVVVKIQVISSSADKCIRIILTSCTSESKLLPLILDNCSSKSPLLRKLCFEFLCLAIASCKLDLIEKHLVNIKQIMRIGVSDADASARKTSRQLYWLLYTIYPSMQGTLKLFLTDLDQATQRHIQSEPVTNAPEVQDLISIHRNQSIIQHAYTNYIDTTNATTTTATTTAAAATTMQLTGLVNKKPTPTNITSSSNNKHTASSSLIETDDDMNLPYRHEEDEIFEAIVTSSKDDVNMMMYDNEHTKDMHINDDIAPTTSMKVLRRLSLTGPQRVLSTNNNNHNNAIVAHPQQLQTHQSVQKMNIKSNILSDRTDTAVLEDKSNKFIDNHYSTNYTNQNHLSTATVIDTQNPIQASSSATTLARKSSSLLGLSDGPKRIARPNNEVANNNCHHHETSDIPHTINSKPTIPTTTEEKVSKGSIKKIEANSNTEHNNQLKPQHNITTTTSSHVNSYNTTTSSSTNNVFVFSGETLRTLAEDSQWTNRLKAFESINQRLQRAKLTNETLNETMIETFIDISTQHFADPHQKVATEAITIVQICVTSYPMLLKNKLGVLLLSLFNRLADRRPAIRDQTNNILNLIRSQINPILIMSSLSPKMMEIPDRMKTALMQFLGAVAPHCEDYFIQSQNTWAFLNRLSQIFSQTNSGVKPSVTLTVAGKRLLELVYKINPQIVCSQIAALPYQQQITLKKYLETSILDIDAQVLMASRAEWNNNHSNKVNTIVPSLLIVPTTSIISPSLSKVIVDNRDKNEVTTPNHFEHINKKIVSPYLSNEEQENSYIDHHNTDITNDINVANITNTIANHTTDYISGSSNNNTSYVRTGLSPSENISPNSNVISYTYKDENNKLFTSSFDEATDQIIAKYSPTSTMKIYNSSTNNTLLGGNLTNKSLCYSSMNESVNSSNTVISPSISSTSVNIIKSSIITAANKQNSPSIYRLDDNHIIEDHSLITSTNNSQSNINMYNENHKLNNINTNITTLVNNIHTQINHQPLLINHELNKDDSILWLLDALKPTQSITDRIIASKELKILIKTASDAYWNKNYAQIVSVLLESFVVGASSSTALHKLGRDTNLLSSNVAENNNSSSSSSIEGFEHIHASTKSLLLLMKYRGNQMKNLLEVLVTKLCQSSAETPLVISQLYELILIDFARYDSYRLIKIILPYTTINNTAIDGTAITTNPNYILSTGDYPQVRLLALHVICSSIHFLTSSQLLDLLSQITISILPSLLSAIAELRKAVIFILVEIFLSIGEGLFPYIQTLTPPQRKLLTIYIEKKIKDRNNITTTKNINC